MPAYKEVVELGRVLRRHRLALGLSQKDVVPDLGVAQPTLARWEQGRRPESEYFDRIAAFLDVERDVVVQLAHVPAEEDGLGDVLVSAHGGRWYLLPIAKRRELARQIHELLDEG